MEKVHIIKYENEVVVVENLRKVIFLVEVLFSTLTFSFLPIDPGKNNISLSLPNLKPFLFHSYFFFFILVSKT